MSQTRRLTLGGISVLHISQDRRAELARWVSPGAWQCPDAGDWVARRLQPPRLGGLSTDGLRASGRFSSAESQPSFS